ncbi:hypothetical protein PINS_up024308, partial [Pythium insidiosum]
LIAHFIEPMCMNPTFLYNHPQCMSPLAKSHRDQPGDQQRGDQEAHSKDDEFCLALEYGLPPTGGFGIGIDDWSCCSPRNAHIRFEVIMFPAMKPRDDKSESSSHPSS